MSIAAGYDFTPLPDGPRREPRPQARHDRRVPGTLSGRVALSYRLDQPVHVGAGHKVVVDGQPVRAQVTSGGRPVVPGASVKGVIRSRYEAITRSCAGGRAPRNQRRIVSQTYPGYEVRLAPSVTQHRVFEACRTRAADEAPVICPACALFGLMNRRSRVMFGDLVSDADVVLHPIAQQFGPRLHHLAEPRDVDVDHAARRLTVRRLRGRKFHGGASPPPVGDRMVVEAMPAGATISGTLRLLNVEPAELGGLLVALGFARPSFVKVGAGKNLGFGRLRPAAIAFTLRDDRGRPLVQAPAEWDAAFERSDDRWADGEAALRAMHTRGGW